jgi:magnesium chelatase family protein
MQVYSWIYDGVTPRPIHVEYHARFQIPTFSILGLPGPEIQEARERIIAAFHASGIEFPKKRIIINLAPASMRKWGTGHDLAIALSILLHALEVDWPRTTLAWGELGLDGDVRPRGQMAAMVELLLRHPVQTLILSPADADALTRLLHWRSENGLAVPKVEQLIRLGHLRDLHDQLKDTTARGWSQTLSLHSFAPPATLAAPATATDHLLPLEPRLERTLEITLTGRHHLMLLGPKGIGKSHSLEWLKAFTPSPSPALNWIRTLRDPSQSPQTLARAPIRQVHSQVRPAHLLGSWRGPALEAGELALSHGGVLIADEFPEWPRDARECLREPLQNKRFLLSRVAGKVEIDCDFQLVATGNLCPCGGLPPQFHAFSPVPSARLKRWRCRCRPPEVEQYLARLSGPVIDRIDLVSVLYELPDPAQPLRSLEEFGARIRLQQAFARERWNRLPSELSPRWLEANLPRTTKIQSLLARLPSLRARHKTARIAYTLQCLAQSDELTEEQVFEASTYRFMDTRAWGSA